MPSDTDARSWNETRVGKTCSPASHTRSDRTPCDIALNTIWKRTEVTINYNTMGKKKIGRPIMDSSGVWKREIDEKGKAPRGMEERKEKQNKATNSAVKFNVVSPTSTAFYFTKTATAIQ
jgi:hypothetical protein